MEDAQMDGVKKEESIEAFIKILVQPSLSTYKSFVIPSDDVQKKVAKQMYAVVILYNLYLRRQFTYLEFVNHVSFCKLAVVVCAKLVLYMSVLREAFKQKTDFDHRASVTEKMVKEACETCEALSTPSMLEKLNGWPISKVAVFVVDSTFKNCILNKGAITDGVYSIIEKGVENIKLGNDSDSTDFKHTKAKLHELAFLAIKEQTGIDESVLEICSTNVAYSVTKKMTSCQMFIMRCLNETTLTSSSNNDVSWVAINALHKIVHNPLLDLSTQKLSTSIAFFHLWPYWDAIHAWLRSIKFFEQQTEDGIKELNSFISVGESKVQNNDILGSTNLHKQIQSPMVPTPDSVGVTMQQTSSDNVLVEQAGILGSSNLQKQVLSSIMPTQDCTEVTMQQTNSGNVLVEEADILGCSNLQKQGQSSIVPTQDCMEEAMQETNSGNVLVQKACDSGKEVPSLQLEHNRKRKDEAATQDKGRFLTTEEFYERCEGIHESNHQLSFMSAGKKPGSNLETPISNQKNSAVQELEYSTCHKKCRIETSMLAEMISFHSQCQEKLKQIVHKLSEGKKTGPFCHVGDSHAMACPRKSCGTSKIAHENSSNPKSLNEGVLSLQCPSQELECLCSRNRWRFNYDVFEAQGNADLRRFHATVTIQGPGFQFSRQGELKTTDIEAKRSAASYMLSELYTQHARVSN